MPIADTGRQFPANMLALCAFRQRVQSSSRCAGASTSATYIVTGPATALLDHFLEALVTSGCHVCTNLVDCLQIHDSVMPDGLHPTKGMDRLANCLSPLIHKYAKN